MSCNQRALPKLAALVVGCGFLASPVAFAADQGFITPGQETFTLNVGGILNEFGTKVRLNGQTSRGTDIDLENNGLTKNHSSFDIAGTWRFAARHRLDAEYFAVDRSGSHDYSNSITIGDNVYPVGATVAARSEQDFFIVDYRYSFIKAPDFEFAGLLGFYGSHFKFDLEATGNQSGAVRSASSSASTTVPLPVIGLTADWYLGPRWKISGALMGIKANIADVDGSVFVAQAAAEYMVWRNAGVGLRYMYSNLQVDVNKSNFDGRIDWRMNSVSLYAKLLF